MKNMKRTLTLLFAAAAMILASCAKNSDVVSPENRLNARDITMAATIADGDSANISGTGVTSGKIFRNGSVYTVKAFRQAYSSAPGQPADGNFYWRFTDNEAGTPSSFNIKFTGIACGDITSNEEIRFINKSFSTVVAGDWSSASAPEDSPAGDNVIGMDQVTGSGVPGSVSDYANGAGWYIYAWGPHTVSPVSGRTLLWKSGSTIYKFEISSIYQYGVTGSGGFPYYHFKYQQL